MAVRNPYFHRVDAQGAAAALSRPVHPRGGRPQADPDQDRRRRDRPAGRGTCSSRTTPSSRRASRAADCATLLWPEGRGAHLALLPQSQRARPGLARAVPRPALPPGAVARHRSGGAEPISLFRAGRAVEQLDHPGTARSTARSIGKRCTAYDPEAANRLLDEIGLDGAMTTARGCCRTAGRWSWSSRPQARTASRPTCWSWSRDQWPRSGSESTPSRPTARCCATGSSPGDALMTICVRLGQRHADRRHAAQDFAPTSQADQPQWPKWGQYYETKGQAGEAPDLPEAKRADGPVPQAGSRLRSRPSRRRSGTDARALHEPMLHAGPDRGACASRWRCAPSCATCQRRRSSTGSRKAQIGIYRPDTFFYARVRRPGAGSFSSQRLLSKAPGDQRQRADRRPAATAAG